MPSSYTNSLRLEQQFTGENINIWGVLLNAVIARLDSSIAGLRTIPLTTNYSLTTANGTDDEARNAIIKTTGTGAFVVTIPAVSKTYNWWNACTGTVTVTTGAGTSVDVSSGEACTIICDGSNIRRVFSRSFDGVRLTNLGSPSAASDACTKGYADSLAFAAASGQLPGQIGADGQFLRTVANVAGWAPITISAIADYATDQATRAGVINANVAAVASSVSNTNANVVTLTARVVPLEKNQATVQTLTISNGTLTVDLSQGTVFNCTLNRNISNVAYINAPPAGTRQDWTLTFIGNTTANTITWTNAVTWPNGVVRHSGFTAPVVNTALGIHTTINQWTEDGGLKVRSSKGAET